MDIKAFAKINLGLDVLHKRADGYHEVCMVMQETELFDELSLEPVPGSTGADASKRIETVGDTSDIISLEIAGQSPDVPTDERNIIYKTARLFMEFYGISSGIRIKAVKHIPSQAGLGGGSADAAAVLKGMNELFSTGASEEELCSLGLRLGADVPFCVMGGTALACGIGERLYRLPPAPHFHVLLAKPAEGISTADIYSSIDGSGLMEDTEGSRERADRIKSIRHALDTGDRVLLCRSMFNIFETVTAERLPYIMELKERLLYLGADAALMSGSGPTVYGLFGNRDKLEEAAGALEAELSAGRLSHLIKTRF